MSFLVDVGKSIWITFFLLGGSYELADNVVSGKFSAIILLLLAGAGGFGEAIFHPPLGGSARIGFQSCALWTPSDLILLNYLT